MACDHCLGDPCGCRHCGSPALEPCPDCEDGNRYYVIDPRNDERIECSKEDYDKTPEDYRDTETCPTCRGNYWI